jgi:hypothetical protein
MQKKALIIDTHKFGRVFAPKRKSRTTRHETDSETLQEKVCRLIVAPNGGVQASLVLGAAQKRGAPTGFADDRKVNPGAETGQDRHRSTNRVLTA